MATATHTFVDFTYMTSDGNIAHKEFEVADDVKPISMTAYRKEVETT